MCWRLHVDTAGTNWIASVHRLSAVAVVLAPQKANVLTCLHAAWLPACRLGAGDSIEQHVWTPVVQADCVAA